MKMNENPGPVSVGAMVVALGVSLACASTELSDMESTAADTGNRASAGARVSDDLVLARLLKEASLSPGVIDVASMADRGIDAALLTAHVEHSDKFHRLRPDDIAYLRDHEVPDTVIAAMMKRGAELRVERASRPQPPPAPWAVPGETPKVVTIVAAAKPPKPPVSTVTVIGRSDLNQGLSYRGHFYSPRNFYSGTYGRAYSSYTGYSRYAPPYRRGYGPRYCR